MFLTGANSMAVHNPKCAVTDRQIETLKFIESTNLRKATYLV